MATEQILTSSGAIDLSDVLPPIEPGYDWTWTFWVKDNNLAALDTTGYTCFCTFQDVWGGTAIISLEIGSGITMTAATGKFVIALTDAETLLFRTQQAVFDVMLVSDSGIKGRPFKGSLLVEQVATEGGVVS